MIAAHARHERAADLDDVEAKLLDQMRILVGRIVERHPDPLVAHQVENGDGRVGVARERA